jgi:Fe-S-cluster formation regulator IscX/YfhJ
MSADTLSTPGPLSGMRSGLTWDNLTVQDLLAIGAALAARYADQNHITMPPEQLAELVNDLPGFQAGDTTPEDFILSAIASAWIYAVEGFDDSSPYEGQS